MIMLKAIMLIIILKIKTALNIVFAIISKVKKALIPKISTIHIILYYKYINKYIKIYQNI